MAAIFFINTMWIVYLNNNFNKFEFVKYLVFNLDFFVDEKNITRFCFFFLRAFTFCPIDSEYCRNR